MNVTFKNSSKQLNENTILCVSGRKAKKTQI